MKEDEQQESEVDQDDLPTGESPLMSHGTGDGDGDPDGDGEGDPGQGGSFVRRPEWWVASGNFASTQRSKKPTPEKTPVFFEDVFAAVPPSCADTWPDAIVDQQAANQAGREEGRSWNG